MDPFFRKLYGKKCPHVYGKHSHNDYGNNFRHVDIKPLLLWYMDPFFRKLYGKECPHVYGKHSHNDYGNNFRHVYGKYCFEWLWKYSP